MTDELFGGPDGHGRVGTWKGLPVTTMETYTGRPVDSVYIRPEDINIRDIAHALALTCRYGGHCWSFYSVAEHSVHCCDVARADCFSSEVQYACLLHDAGEAYWHDLGRPLKRAFLMDASYCRYLDRAQRAVEVKFGVDRWCGKTVKSIDNEVLKYEARRLMPSRGERWEFLEEIEEAPISPWSWLWFRLGGNPEWAFLRRFRKLHALLHS